MDLDKEIDTTERTESPHSFLSKGEWFWFWLSMVIGFIAGLSFIPGKLYSPPNIQTVAMTPMDSDHLSHGLFLYEVDLSSQLIYPTRAEYICNARREVCSNRVLTYEKNLCYMANVTWFTLTTGASYSCEVLASIKTPFIVRDKQDFLTSVAIGIFQLMVCSRILVLPRYSNDSKARNKIILLNAFSLGFVLTYLVVKAVTLYILYTPPQLDPLSVPVI